MLKNKYYKARDLYIACLLISKGQKLLKLDTTEYPYWFIFQDQDICEELVETYWNEAVEVNAKKFADTIKLVKERIFNEKEREGK